ncbi:hypothetical protein [Nocardioides sp. Arc9.136]|uniref:hypothetical protein n=1 Tax=Nocardioides sp. Arc9.136 TaxID=2996826 RepID=UPI0026653087|nr:hypothetical protein [Nocardioides sp. Arc9.136]WKN47115.1 hypothetical protein OSR43_13815 [Nocardioides sp. Arc9.136]
MSTVRDQLIERQSTDVLVALVQHIRDQGLGTPLAITPPSSALPYFSLAIAHYSLDAWLASPLVEVLDTETAPSGNRRHEHITVTIRFAGLIPIRLVTTRTTLQAVPA